MAICLAYIINILPSQKKRAFRQRSCKVTDKFVGQMSAFKFICGYCVKYEHVGTTDTASNVLKQGGYETIFMYLAVFFVIGSQKYLSM